MVLSSIVFLAGILLLAFAAYDSYRCQSTLCALGWPQSDGQLSYSGFILLVASAIGFLIALKTSQRGSIPPSTVSN
jgi:hypothetical protein